MSVAGWSLANPAGLLWGLLAIPILALHILKPRRVQAVVSSVFLWRRIDTPVTAASPWQRLIPSWLLAVQLATVLLLALAMAQPIRLTDRPLAEHTIFVIDSSGSMQAGDGSPSRLAAAVDRASDLRREVPVNGEASLIVAGSRARAIITHSSEVNEFDDALERVEPSFGAGDFDGAFALAAGLDTGDRPSRVVLLSDGGVTPSELRAAPVGTRYERIGSTGTNRGITQFSVEPGTNGLVARATATHFGGPEATQTLRIDVDGVTRDRRELTLRAGDVANESFPIPNGERIEAFLESEDGLDLDDRAVATVARRPEIDVLWVGPDNAFLDAALTASPGITVIRASADTAVDAADEVDLVIIDGVNLPSDLDASTLDLPVLAIAPPDGLGPITPRANIDRPILTFIDSQSPLVRDLDLTEVLIAQAQRLELPTEAEVLLGAEGTPLLVSLDGPDQRVTYLAFPIDQSTLPLQAAFPILIDRLLADLADAITPPSRLTVGDDLPVDPRSAALITSPLGTTVELPPGSAIPAADRVGFWTVEQQDRLPITIAVNGDRAESLIAPAPDLPFEEAFEGTAGSEAQGEVPFLQPILAVLLILVGAEWLLARRRIGVGARQWQIARVLRVVVAAAVVIALLGPTLRRSSNEVATVFLIDASDSMGPAGRAEASEFVQAALESRPADDRSGVVVFGQDARLETLVDDDPLFDRISVQVDPSATDLSAALRLGAAALPSDARQRLVLISDGRATTGDVTAETQRLSDEATPVDVIVIDPGSGRDLAVSGVDVPPVARAGEAVEIEVRIFAPASTPADVTLRSDSEIVESRRVELTAGDNTVRFIDVAGSSGVLRYQVEVDGTGDTVRANDIGFAAIPVAGAERVLIVEGRDGVGANLVAALEASGLDSDTVSASRFPAIDELTRYASIVLVDVDGRDLADAQVAALDGAVRDLGRGLVVIGGTHSYALGGYRDSELEELLPVISEITDPLRRQTVAEVLAVDTSGSMGACHCDEDGNNGLGGGNRIDGGVNKTAIARNAASRAIAALASTDEVGVLSMDAADRWVIDLQPRPSQEVIDAGLSELVPDGPTFLDTGLETAAEQLRASSASLKHIIFFSDGFTEPGLLAEVEDQATKLRAEGITVSVVATGEGAANELQPIAEAGGGRFYPGRNLEQIPELIVQEAILASRDFVNEGVFLPLITSSSPVVQSLTESPPLFGYLATTAKPAARVDLRIGPDEDPLLVSWQVGLGRVAAWTSDGTERWATSWSGWPSAPDFWAGLVKDTFPTTGDGGGIQARIEGSQLELRLEGADVWAEQATAVARVAGPDGSSLDVPLERLDGSTFAATVPVDEAGTYAVGASVESNGETVWSGVGLTSRSYPAEYIPRPIGEAELARVAVATGGRIDPTSESLFDAAGTVAGSRSIDLTRWLLLLALLTWPIAVGVSRVAWRSGVLAVSRSKASATIDELRQRVPKMTSPSVRPQAGAPSPDLSTAPPPTRPPDVTDPSPSSPIPPGSDDDSADDDTSTVDRLLARKRRKD